MTLHKLSEISSLYDTFLSPISSLCSPNRCKSRHCPFNRDILLFALKVPPITPLRNLIFILLNFIGSQQITLVTDHDH
jgi:hypothetical protein